MNTSAQDVLARFQAQRLIPVFYHADVALTRSVIETCYQAGLTVFEYTRRGPDTLHHFHMLKAETRQLPGLVLGIGTLFSLRDAMDYLAAGADFIVSPALVPEMAIIQQKEKKLWIPGCATVTEIATARTLGARLIKVYPAHQLGTPFLQAVRAVLPDVELMPTGGIPSDREGIGSWFRAGATCVGLGATLFTSEFIQPANQLQSIQYLKSLAAWASQTP